MDFVDRGVPGSAPGPPDGACLAEAFIRAAKVESASVLVPGSTGRRDRIRVPGSIVPEAELIAIAAVRARDDEVREVVQ